MCVGYEIKGYKLGKEMVSALGQNKTGEHSIKWTIRIRSVLHKENIDIIDSTQT